MRTEKRRQLTIALAVCLIFTLLIGLANLVNAVAERNRTLEAWDPIAGLLMGCGAFPRLQVLPFASFLANLLLYLWTENLILAALIHTVGGSVGLAVNGTLFNQVDELRMITAVIMAGLFAYMSVYEVRHKARPYHAGWWMAAEIESGVPEA